MRMIDDKGRGRVNGGGGGGIGGKSTLFSPKGFYAPPSPSPFPLHPYRERAPAPRRLYFVSRIH